MRTLVLAALTMVTAFGATTADAQRLGARSYPGASYPMPGMQQPGGGVPVNLPPPPSVNTMPQRPFPGQANPQRPYPVQNGPQRPHPGQTYPGSRPSQGGAWQGGGQYGGSRWGGSVGGHWSGGMNAPGGWNAYRRPSNGYRLPSYWVSPNFYIGDFGGYGLYAPPQGYGWQRYYDDAVLVDDRGRVRDSVYGVDWDGGYGGDSQSAYASSDYGYAYAQGGAGGQAYAPAPQYQPLPPVSQQGNVTTYSTSSGYAQGGYAQGGYQGGYASGGYYYPGATTTVVTIQGAPSVTTTTTEYVEETTTRTRYVAPRRVYRVKKRVYRPARCACRRAAPVEQPVLGS